MSNSAQALNEVLSFANKSGAKGDRFLEVVANYLGLEGELAVPTAVTYLYSIMLDLRADIDALPIAEGEKKLLNRHLTPFNGLLSLAHVHMDMNNAKANFLKADNLVGLTYIQLALNGHCDRKELDSEAKEFAESARNLAAEISKSSLPERAAKVMAARLLQISSALDHFNFVGPQALEEKLESLFGAIFVHAEKADTEEEKKLFRRAFRVFEGGLSALKKVDEGIGVGISLSEKGQQIADLLSK